MMYGRRWNNTKATLPGWSYMKISAVNSGHSGTGAEWAEFFLRKPWESLQERLEKQYSSQAHYYYLSLLLEKYGGGAG
ncbi:MAG: hypothetical protein R3B47_20710 [Bacteroidia bacterium]